MIDGNHMAKRLMALDVDQKQSNQVLQQVAVAMGNLQAITNLNAMQMQAILLRISAIEKHLGLEIPEGAKNIYESLEKIMNSGKEKAPAKEANSIIVPGA